MTRRNAALKKGWTTALALAAVVTLSACGGQSEASTEGNPAASSSPAATKAPAKIEIKYWYAWGDKIGENNENLVKKFNESQDKIHVTAEYQGTYDDLHAKTQAAFAAKNAPEVTQNEIASVKIFAESGMTQDLTSLVERDQVDLTDFVPGLMGNSYVDDKLYALPYLRSTPLLYLNATLLKQANLDTAGPKTWDELREYSRKLTVPGQRVGISMAPSAWYFEAFLAQSGSKVLEEDGKHIAFNNEAGVNILKYWLDMNKEGIVTIPTTDDAGEVSKQDFLNQRSAMFFSSTADLTKIRQVATDAGVEINTTFMPSNKSYGVPTGGCNLVMISGLPQEKQDAAWEFIKWMTAKEQTIYASSFTGYLPSRQSAIASDEMYKLYAEVPQFKVAVDQLQYAHPRPMEASYPEIAKYLQTQFAKAVLDTKYSPEQAISDIAKKAEELLKK